MRLLPPSRIARVEFFEVHLEPWTQHAETLGLSEAELAALAGLVGEARAAFTAQQEAADAARAATLRFHTALRAMQAAGAGAIRTIRNTAESGGGAGGGDANIYVLAQIPPPGRPGRMPPPGTPFAFEAALLPTGAVELTFKCRHPGRSPGTMYEVQRRTETAANADGRGSRLEYLGLTGRKRFLDDTLPAGAAEITYQVTAVHSTGRGDPARFTVSIGVGSGTRRPPAMRSA